MNDQRDAELFLPGRNLILASDNPLLGVSNAREFPLRGRHGHVVQMYGISRRASRPKACRLHMGNVILLPKMQ